MKRYQKQFQVLESEKISLQRENEELRSKLSGVLNSSSRLRKLHGLEEEVSALKKKVEGSSLRLGRDAEMKSLQNEIFRLKAQKVESQRKMKEEMIKEIAGLKRQEELSKQNDIGCIVKDEEMRALLQDVEANRKDKDTEIRRLKEEVAKLSDLVKQLEMQKAEHICASNLKNADAIEGSKEDAGMSKESRSSITSNYLGNSGVSYKSKHSSHSEGITASASISKTSSTLTCCSCSNKFSCKTSKCECRESGASCGTSCGCSSKKCSNRDAASMKVDESPVADVPNGVNSSGSAVIVEETTILAAHGAMLLQDALLAKSAQNNDKNESRRKPLSDIGNKMKGDAAKPSQKKKNQNLKGHPAAAPMAPFQQENSNTPEQSDVTSTGDMDVPKFTRTTRSNSSK